MALLRWDTPTSQYVNLRTGAHIDPGVPPVYSDANPPWQLRAGESYTDNMPAGVPMVKANELTSSDDIYDVLQAANSLSSGSYIELDSQAYYINSFRNYGVNDYRGWTNSGRKVMGLFSREGPDASSVRVAPGAIAASPGATDYILAKTSAGGPVAVTALYMSNTETTVPLFLSGISFDGSIQGPPGVYSVGSQAQFRMNHSVPTPLAYRGLALWRGIAGSRMQFCRFRGFGYALTNAPPFENGFMDTNYMDGFLEYRNEYDGRVPAYSDPARPRASGGLMWNKGINQTVQDSWLHDTRRSGWATNTNTGLEAERYKGINFQVENIGNGGPLADGNDGLAGSWGFFPGSNVEAVVGTFEYENVHINTPDRPHINWAVPRSGTTSGGDLYAPDHAVIKVKNFTTDDTEYGGCLRIQVLQQPNSTGQSRVWEKLNSLGIAGSGFFEIRRPDGSLKTGVRHSAWNTSMSPNDYFVVTY